MAKVVGDIAVQVGADVTNLLSGMDRAGKSTRKFGRDFERDSTRMQRAALKIGAGLTAAAGAAVVAFGAIAKEAIENAKQIENLSRVAGVGVERFQAMTFAAGQFGVEQEKLADILKDVNDKVGDFLSTGAGPMADFFENIGPKVGVTADQFRNLSSADALQLYVSSLEKANVSQAEMTFYMEAIASDATLLVPLLAQSGAEMDRLGQSAADLGIILGEDVVNRTARMGEVWSKVLASMKSVFISFASAVLIGFDDIFNVTDFARIDDMNAKIDTLNKQRNQLLGARETAREGFGGLDPLSGGAAELRNQADTAIAEVEAEIAIYRQQVDFLDAEFERRQEAVNRINNADTDVPVSRTGGGGGGRSVGPSEADLERLQESLLTENELIIADYEQKLELLRQFREDKKLTEEEYNALEQELTAQHYAQLKQIQAMAQAERISSVLGAGSEIIGALSSGNDKMFKIAKAFNAAMALMDAWGAYNKVLNDPTPMPWWVRLSAAASVLAAGLQTVNAIKGVSKSGSGSGGASAGGAGGGSGVPVQQTSNQVAVQLVGGDMFGRDQVIQLVNAINEAQEDGAIVRLV